MITEQTKDFLGELLFDTIGTAIREAGAVMRFTGWKLVDEKTKTNYMAIVERICDAVVKDRKTIDVTEPVPEGADVIVIDNETVVLSPEDAPESSLLASVMGEDKAHPVTLAPEVPKSEVPLYVSDKPEKGKKGNRRKKVTA